MIDTTINSYINSSIQYSISSRATKPSISTIGLKAARPTATPVTESAQSVSRVYVTKQFSHQKVEYVRKQNKNTL
ncbi:MAG: hypothetical protein PWQ10_199 [Patescibacteria group bacterium]|nr:hypothetical protein [Patescibacteria group bacterium]